MSVHLYDLFNNQHFSFRFLWVFPVFLNDFNRHHDHSMAEEQEKNWMIICSFNTFFRQIWRQNAKTPAFFAILRVKKSIFFHDRGRCIFEQGNMQRSIKCK